METYAYRRTTTRRSLISAVVLALISTSCGLVGPTRDDAVTSAIEATKAARSDLTRALEISTGSGESSESLRAMSAAWSSLEALDDAVGDLGSADLTDSAEDFSHSTELALDLLSEGRVEVAAEVAIAQVEPKHDRLLAALAALESGASSSRGGNAGLLVALTLVAALAVLAVFRRRPSPAAPAQSPVTSEVGTASSFPEDPLSSLNSPLPPIGSEPPMLRPEPARATTTPEPAHTLKGGLRTVELESVIDAALATVADAGWEVAIQCPDVRVLVDPLRMRRVLSNLFLSATAYRAEHVGVVAEIVGDKVAVNVGHDGELLADLPDDGTTPREIEHQLTVARQLLGGMHAHVRWTRGRGVSLYTVELVRGPEEIEAPAQLAEVGG